MSNKKTEADAKQPSKVQLKVDVSHDVRERLRQVSKATGFSQSQIVTMLIRYYCNELDVEHDTRRMLAKVASDSRQLLKLSKKQKQTLRENVVDGKFTKDLI